MELPKELLSCTEHGPTDKQLAFIRLTGESLELNICKECVPTCKGKTPHHPSLDEVRKQRSIGKFPYIANVMTHHITTTDGVEMCHSYTTGGNEWICHVCYEWNGVAWHLTEYGERLQYLIRGEEVPQQIAK